MRKFLKAVLFNSFPLQQDKDMHNNLAKFYVCTFCLQIIRHSGTVISSLTAFLSYH